MGAVAIAGADGTLSPLTDEGDRPQLQPANVTFTSFLARNLDGELVGMTAALPFTVDVLQVMNGRQVTSPSGSCLRANDEIVASWPRWSWSAPTAGRSRSRRPGAAGPPS